MREPIPKPFTGPLSVVDAANVIRAARLNAIDLLESAEILHSLKRFAHSMALSTLAIEEAAKGSIVFLLVLSEPSDHAKLWKSYRSHRAKSDFLNPGIESRVRAVFPQVSADQAKTIGKSGPSPEHLEYNKQMAIYSDCRGVGGQFVCHLPQLAEWRVLAWERLCEAQALVHGLRDRTPDELRAWLKHMQNRAVGTTFMDALRNVHEELLAKGLIQKGWWDTLLKDAEDELEATQAANSPSDSQPESPLQPNREP
jgi:AbiV family abortive infection protein